MQRFDSTPALGTWGQRWLGAIGDFGRAYRTRLDQGRTIALDGRVARLAVFVGGMDAQVLTSSYWSSYEVNVEIAPLPNSSWNRLIDQLASQASYATDLLANRMPADIDHLLTAAHTTLIPQRPSEVSSTCTCNEGGPMCRHAAAAHYVIATNLDTQTLLLFTLRGRSIDDIMDALRERWAASAGGGAGAAARDAEAPLEPAPPEPPPHERTRPLSSTEFYRPGAALDDFSVAIAPPQVEAALLKRLGKPPFAEPDEDITPALTEVYTAVTRRALQALSQTGEKSRKSSR